MKWYCHFQLKPQGPFSQDEIRQKIHRGEIGPQDLISDESGQWQDSIDSRSLRLRSFPSSSGGGGSAEHAGFPIKPSP